MLARVLWRAGATHHCHEPFEAVYWGGADFTSVETALARVIEIDTGDRVATTEIAGPATLLMKEMTFQLRPPEFRWLAALANAPVIFVMRDPRLSATSRLRIVGELSGAKSFPPFESGWPSLVEQVAICRDAAVPYVIVDTGALRADPDGVAAKLAARTGIAIDPSALTWPARHDLQLCAPEVGAMMGGRDTAADPFYRRVLASTSVEPPDKVDLAQAAETLEAAGLGPDLADWLIMHRNLRSDPNFAGKD